MKLKPLLPDLQSYSQVSTIILEKSVERGIIVQDTGFTVLSKNFSFAYRDVGEGREQDAEASPIG